MSRNDNGTGSMEIILVYQIEALAVVLVGKLVEENPTWLLMNQEFGFRV